MENIIYYGIMLVVSVIAFIVGKYVFPKVPREALTVLSDWAAKFVIWAKEFMDGESGETKMATVVNLLMEIAEEQGFEVTEARLQAIVQAAYENFVKGEADA